MGILLTIILIFFILGWILRRLLPIILVRWVNKKMGNNTQPPKSARRPEGDVYVSKDNDNGDKIVERNMGEYVDFETIREEDKNGNV